MNGLEIIKAARTEFGIIESFNFYPEKKALLESTLSYAVTELLEEIDIDEDDYFTRSPYLIHDAISKSFNPYACFLYFTLTGRHKILKPIPHVEGDELVYIYNDILKSFKKISNKQIMNAADAALDHGLIKKVFCK
ncbi:hypothetical protein AU074_13905 [Pseudomonas sp. ATCC PTA-122608]|uniref:hypothetical protein n=1 Tax=Pseudomonas sp. ATCC PTA-122608 TaxID=1771311 RepID=UPI00096B7F6D|nr:hypothetical protein [Pseudomonas sp. ATCC PTA-122608]OLY72265.1 hypothetical protein AU074_13905 [Pseudomonas sp. ATCC PTA-122608]